MIVFDPCTPRKSYLRDIGCLSCGSRGPFDIRVEGIAQVHDHVVLHAPGETTWRMSSPCVCVKCGRSATVADFTIPGLDAELEQGRTVVRRNS